MSYEHKQNFVNKILNVNPSLEFVFMNKLYKLYQQEYVLKEKCIQIDPSLEMKIILSMTNLFLTKHGAYHIVIKRN